MPSIKHITILLCGLALAACTTIVPDDGTMRYARWITMTDSTASVLNPWREGEVLHIYRLPASADEACSRAVSGTSLHAYLAYRLGALDHLAGVMDAGYVVASELKAALAADSLRDLGSSQSPNLERIKASGCDLIFASPFENAGYGPLETLGIPIVECADYMEPLPLGRAEWIRFYGRLLGRAAQADSLYAAEEAAYHSLCHPSRQKPQATEGQGIVPETSAEGHPTVLLGKRAGQAWYVPGGKSYLGTLLDDADTRYVFADDASTGSIPLDFETVYTRAKDADLWIITYAAPPTDDGTFAPLSYADLAAEDERYMQFRAFREHHIWACNTLAVPYYDALPWSPAALLRDILLMAHPERFPNEAPTYFHPLNP